MTGAGYSVTPGTTTPSLRASLSQFAALMAPAALHGARMATVSQVIRGGVLFEPALITAPAWPPQGTDFISSQRMRGRLAILNSTDV